MAYFGWTERLFAAALIAALIAQFAGAAAGTLLLLRFVATILGFAVAWRIGVRLIRKAIWRLRNRLIVAYLFIAVVPILLLFSLAEAGAWMISGQVAAFLLNIEMERRAMALKQIASSMTGVSPEARAEAVRRVGTVFRDRYPGLEILVRDANGKEVRFPEDSHLQTPPPSLAGRSGIVIREKTFHLWSHLVQDNQSVVVLVPLTRGLLQSFVPQLGDIQLTPLGIRPGESKSLDLRLHAPLPDEPPTPPPSGLASGAPSLVDLRLKWGVSLKAPEWEAPDADRTVFLGVVTRISGPLRIIFGIDTSNEVPSLIAVFTVFAIGFAIVELVSAYIGISMTRTITSAVHNLYEGTEHVKRGNLAHRIDVHGNDQLAELSASFNDMTENLQRLLAGEKERQRLQAELEIAREVQAQLHPKPMEGLGSLRVTSICIAARMVSGDYFDYQPISESRLAIAIGDVAGKGISAALLMATLQSALRNELRHSMDQAKAASVGLGESYSPPRVSTAQIVSNLNQQLFASTAPEKYATFFFSMYDDVAGTLNYTNAGHLSPFLIRRGEATLLDSNGMVVGAFPFARYGESTIHLESGDLLVCYTDGITEPENEYGEMFGEERLLELLLANSHMEGPELANVIAQAVQQWTSSAELQDDMTILLARKV
jgi:phosphoserine phosphatase RsbU/P